MAKGGAVLARGGMFSLGDAAPANFVTNIAGEVAVVVSGHKYHK